MAQYNPWIKSLIQAGAFAGCYEMRVPAWSVVEARRLDLLPLRFQLTSLSAQTDGIWFVARNQDPKVRHAMLFASWRVDPDGTIDLGWSTGYVGYNIQLTGPAAELRGTAQYWTDTDPRPPAVEGNRPLLKVVAHRDGCPGSAN